MATEVKVPTTGNAGEPAVVLEWNVGVGDTVSAGDVVATLETAKAVVEVDAPEGGVVLEIRFAEGDEAPEHEVLLVIGVAGESSDASTPAIRATTTTVAAQEERPAADLRQVVATPRPGQTSTRISISPRARRLAGEHGIDITTMSGSGPFGRIVIADVEAVSASVRGNETAADATPAGGRGSGTKIPVRGARKITAQRMHASLQSTAQVTITRYAAGDALHAFASRLRETTDARGIEKVGINDLLLFAAARTVARHPSANSWFDWDGITQFDHVDLGFAVDTGSALLVPVIRDAQTLSLADLAARAHLAIDRARSGKTSPEEMEGGTFTLSNLGGAGIHWFTPVLNTPQSCILGVGAMHRAYPEAPAQLPLSLTFDHRALDGSAAAALLADLARSIEFIDTLAAF